MQHILMMATVILTLAVPGVAASSGALPYDLKLSGPLGPAPGTAQVKAGSTFGGVPVTGTVKGTSTVGSFNLYADGKLFASGAYSCSASCTFAGTIAGKTVTGMSLTASTSSSGSAPTVTGRAASRTFSNHGAWVSSVTSWANANLPAVQRGQVISGAAKIEGRLASDKTDPSHKGSQVKGQDDDKGKALDKDKGQDKDKGKDDNEKDSGNGDAGKGGTGNGNGGGNGSGNGGGSEHGKP